MTPHVYGLEFDEGNEQELARHAVSNDEVLQVFDGDPVFLPNRRGRAGTILMVGPTLGGRFLTVPLAPTAVHGFWRPVTGWTSAVKEVARYRAARRR